MSQGNRPLFFPKSSSDEESYVGKLLRQETVGGAVVLVAAVVAVLWANSPWADAYEELRHLQIGPLDVQHWAADGALTLFFYVTGLELKREFVVGSLRKPADALVPMVAAACGVMAPALIYVAVNTTAADGRLEGWAIPAATDIAFALAVLAVVGSSLPTPLRIFLLTLAVVDDLIVIVIIAAFYTSELHLPSLGLTLIGLVVFALLQKYRGESWLWYVPLSIAIWWFMHECGIHATIAGVAMGLLTRVKLDPGEKASPAVRLEHTLTPLSAGVAVPFFALMSAGVAVAGGGEIFSDPVVIGVVARPRGRQADRGDGGSLGGHPVHPRRAQPRADVAGHRRGRGPRRCRVHRGPAGGRALVRRGGGRGREDRGAARLGGRRRSSHRCCCTGAAWPTRTTDLAVQRTLRAGCTDPRALPLGQGAAKGAHMTDTTPARTAGATVVQPEAGAVHRPARRQRQP